MAISLIDIVIFIVGLGFGIVFGFYTGKLIFHRFFSQYEDAITFESAVKFESIQQLVNYGFGFALATMTINPIISVVFMAVWLAFQTWLALQVFGFPKAINGLTYSFIDTGADLIMGVTFGAGAATFTLVRMALVGA